MVDQGGQLGDFRIRGILGEGGGGVVYAADGPDGVIALKVPHPQRELTERDRRRYLAEAAMMSRVSHPAIVGVLASGILPDGRPFVAMPRLSGHTVAERVSEDGPFDLDTALSLIEQLADATMALHEADLLHRDLKAENVFLCDGDEAVKLLDFGIAKDRKAPVRHTTTGMVRGTPATMAPERFFGSEATEQSDIYELAVVFYVMVVGRLPWAGEETDVAARANPMPPHIARAGISYAVSEVVLGALATRPEQRPRTPRDFVNALRAAAAEPAKPMSNATVTSDHLRHLIEPLPQIDNQTPFDAAVASRPDGRPEARVPRRGLAGLALAAALALLAGRELVSSRPDAMASASFGPTLAGVSVEIMAQLEATRTAMAPAPALRDTPTKVPAATPKADAPKTDPTPKAGSAKAPIRTTAKVTKAAPAAAPDAAPTEPAPIPGGVHGTSPY
ncbi:MAG: protein kinase [Polyangiaceae bacterium]